MNARIKLATEAAAPSGKARGALSPSEEKEELAQEVSRVRAMLRIMADLTMNGQRGTVELETEALGDMTEELSDRLKAVSERILKL